MKNILFVVDERRMGGVSIVLETICKSLPEFKFDILVLHNNGDRLENLNNVNLIYGTPIFDVCDLSIKQILIEKNIRKLIKKLYFAFLIKTNLIKRTIIRERKKILNKKYDIEISFKDGFGTFFVAYGDTLKKVRWLHNDYSKNNPGKNYKTSFSKAIDKFDLIIAISEVISQNFNKKYNKQEITEVIHNMVYMPQYQKQKKEHYDFEIVSVGRLAKVKGYDRIINVINRLNQEGYFKNSVLKIVGNGPEEKNLKAMVKNYNLNNKVNFYGEKKDPWTYLQNGDLFIMSSYFEAYPLTIIEAQLMNIPVLTTNYSSSQVMLDKKYGCIVENNEEEIYLKLKNLIINKEQLLMYKKNLQNYNYDNEKIIKQIKKIIMR